MIILNRQAKKYVSERRKEKAQNSTGVSVPLSRRDSKSGQMTSLCGQAVHCGDNEYRDYKIKVDSRSTGAAVSIQHTITQPVLSETYSIWLTAHQVQLKHGTSLMNTVISHLGIHVSKPSRANLKPSKNFPKLRVKVFIHNHLLRTQFWRLLFKMAEASDI